jgi:hypothetical protein
MMLDTYYKHVLSNNRNTYSCNGAVVYGVYGVHGIYGVHGVHGVVHPLTIKLDVFIYWLVVIYSYIVKHVFIYRSTYLCSYSTHR